MKKSVFPLLLVLVFTTSMAQTGDWDTYLARYEKGPGSTLVNMSLKQKAPDSTRPFLFAAGVKFKNCTTDGLPAPTAFITLNRISDSIVALLGRHPGSLLTGTFSYQCERKDYFYVSDTTGLKTAVTRLLADFFPGYTPAFLIKEDKAWDAYLHFLYPNEETRLFMYNQGIVMRLEKSGDNTALPRPIDHFLFFKTEKDRECFIYKAISQQYKIVTKDSTDRKEGPYRLQITRNDKADLETVNKITSWVKKEAARCKGEYEGWETVILQLPG
jgi:hypothetical protein